jgi:DNA-binding MarR family transcriptional regulator
VKVHQAEDDGRRRAIVLTPKGRGLLPIAYPLWRKAQSHLEDLLGENDTARLNKALDRSLDRLNAAT